MTAQTTTINILLVEDIDSEAELILRHLRQAEAFRFTVEHYSRLTPALDRARLVRFDVVLLDLNLPDGSGIDVCRRMREATAQTPIVILTNQANVDLDAETLRAGAQDYLSKRAIDGRLLERSIRYAIERTQAARALRESEDRYSLAVAGANDGIWDWNIQQEHLYVSPRWKRILNCSDEEVGEDPSEWFDRIDPRDRTEFEKALADHLDGATPFFECDYRIVVSKGGGARWVSSRGLAVRDDSGTPIRIAGSMTDITRRKETEARLLHDSIHDALTGLPNRVLLMDRLTLNLRRFKRDTSQLFAVLYFDLDRFKHVNDSLGHGIGDELLRGVARRVPSCLRPGDTLARLGGDEFAIVLNDVTEPGDAIRVAERVRESLASRFEIGTYTLYTTASIGIAISSAAYQTSEEMLRDADTAMYRAKAAGGHANYAVFDTSMHDHAMFQHHMETDLRRALENQEFEIHYQPIISMQDERLQGFEALLRWRHPVRGLVMPDDFINIVETTSLVVPLGWWVLEKACTQLVQWQQVFPMHPPLAMSVNVSGRLFLADDLPRRLKTLLDRTGVAPGSVRLEITERVVMDHGNFVLKTLSQLRAIGIELHVDDFGTGYSSLSCLQRFRYDTLKIDRSFIQTMCDSGDSHAIVEAIITLGNALGVKVIAEGIESAEQAQRLRAMRCPAGQGFWFSRPIPEDAVKDYIRDSGTRPGVKVARRAVGI